MTKVSVVVPAYNVAPYLARCLDSLVAQTLPDIEIICVDDKSTDNSLEIARGYAAKDKRIKVIALPQNGGVGAARNAGLAAAKGEFIHFCDPDDFVDLDFFEKLYNAAKKDNLDVVRGNFIKYNLDGGIDRGASAKNAAITNPLCYDYHWIFLFKKDFLRKNNLKYDEDLPTGQDTVFIMRAMNAYGREVPQIMDANYHYIIREDSLWQHWLGPRKIKSRIMVIERAIEIINKCEWLADEDYGNVARTRYRQIFDFFYRTTSAE
ncbi:MAG: glycosyltransferase [Rickettsiales bacterium]|nr:glycosyltransferase [Rickettsiales bacterium]